jgi:hypothetical protein
MRPPRSTNEWRNSMKSRNAIVASVAIALAGCGAVPRTVKVEPPVGLVPPERITKVAYGDLVPGNYVAGNGNHLWIVFGSGPVDLFRQHCDGMGGELGVTFDDGYICIDPVDF